MNYAAPRVSLADPPRRRVPVISGVVAVRVEIPAASTFRPRTVTTLLPTRAGPNAAPCFLCP